MITYEKTNIKNKIMEITIRNSTFREIRGGKENIVSLLKNNKDQKYYLVALKTKDFNYAEETASEQNLILESNSNLKILTKNKGLHWLI